MTESGIHNMYFVAIVCPPELDKKILKFKKWVKDRYGPVVALKSPAHITLIHSFWLDESREMNLQNTFERFKFEVGELEIQLDGFSFFCKRTLFIRVHKDPTLSKLKQLVGNHFATSFGDAIKIGDQPFQPHVTIANRDIKPGDFEKAWQHFEKIKFAEKFCCSAISLLKLVAGKWQVIGEKKWK